MDPQNAHAVTVAALMALSSPFACHASENSHSLKERGDLGKAIYCKSN